MNLDQWRQWRRAHYYDGTPRPADGPHTLLDRLLSTEAGARALRQADLEYTLIKRERTDPNKVVSLKFNREVHELSGDCDDYHCAYHDVDEVPSRRDGAIRCGECWHMYRTARELRQVFRREVVAQVHANWLRKLWLRARVRVGHIYFCPLCAHDF